MTKSKEISIRDEIISKKYFFWKFKRIFDLIICFLLLPILAFFTVTIPFLNFFYNKGSVFFIQKRMGKNCEPFYAIKFRTMIHIEEIDRKYSDPIEVDRITELGRILRKTRIDELPQIINSLN